MSRALPFTQAGVARALKAATAAGMPVSRVEIDREGKIIVIFGSTQDPAEPPAAAGENEWDEVLAHAPPP